jgi:hypothetical protein
MATFTQLSVRELAQAVLAEQDQHHSFVNHRLGQACDLMMKRLVNGTLVARNGKGANPRGAYSDGDVALIDAYAERYLRVKGL